jgi:hypothetical protein
MAMDEGDWGAVAGLAQVGAGLLGEWWGSADDKQKLALQREAYALYGDISPPVLERLLAEKLGPSAYEAIPDDLGNRAPRDLAIQRLIESGLAGGMDAESLAAMDQGRRAGALQSAQGNAAARQEAQRRGLGGAGAIYAQQAAQQAGQDRAAMVGMQAAGDARSRALAALAQGGGMAGQAEAQDFARRAQRAEAADRIAQFNARMAADARLHNAGLAQQEFDNQMAIRDSKSRALLGQAGTYGSEAERKRRKAGGLGQALAYGLSALGQYYGGGNSGGGGTPPTYTNPGYGGYGGYGFGGR